MLGQEDFEVDTSGDLQFKDDPRSFRKQVGGASDGDRFRRRGL